MTFCITEATTLPPELQTQNNVNTLSCASGGVFNVSVFSCVFQFYRGKAEAFSFVFNKLNLDSNSSESRATQVFYVCHCLIYGE